MYKSNDFSKEEKFRMCWKESWKYFVKIVDVMFLSST